MKPKLIVLTGQTTAGKTSLSLSLAKKYNCEIISADSRQVYRGMDIGTDKIKDKKGIKHYLLDVASPKRTFTVARYSTLAKAAVKQILKKSKMPLMVGGTGFYIEALIYDLQFPKVKPNKMLRNMLRNKTASQLFAMLKKLDANRAEAVDENNKVRLVRAIEIAKTLGRVPPLSRSSPYTLLILGLQVSNAKLKSKINRRVDKRFSSIVAEIKRLRSQKMSFKRLISLGIEYRFISYYLMGKIDKQEALEQSKTATWQFAKRQKTYFKRLPIVWVKKQREAEKKIKEFLET